MMMSKALLTVERYFSHNITTQKLIYTKISSIMFILKALLFFGSSIVQSIIASWIYDVSKGAFGKGENLSPSFDESLQEAMCRAVDKTIKGNDSIKERYTKENLRYYKETLYEELVKLKPVERKTYINKDLYKAFTSEVLKSPNARRQITYSLLKECRKNQKKSIVILADLKEITESTHQNTEKLIEGQKALGNRLDSAESRLESMLLDIKSEVTNKNIANISSELIEHLLPKLKKFIKDFKVKSALSLLDKIQEEVKDKAKDNFLLQARIEYLRAVCKRYIKDEKSIPSYIYAYKLMLKTGSEDTEIIGGRIFAYVSEKKLEEAKKLSLSLRSKNEHNPWAWIPEMLQTSDPSSLYSQIPEDLKEQGKFLGELLLLNSDIPFNAHLVSWEDKIYIPDKLNLDTIPLWVLNLSIALNKLINNWAYDSRSLAVPPLQHEAMEDYRRISDNYLKLQSTSESSLLMPDIKFINYYCSFMNGKDNSYLTLISEEMPSENFYEIYVLMKLNIMSILQLKREAIAFIDQQEKLTYRILGIRLILSMELMDTDSIKESYKMAVERNIVFPPFQYGYFVSSLKDNIKNVYEYAIKLKFENKNDEEAYHLIAKVYNGDEVDINQLKAHEAGACPMMHIIIADAYNELGNTNDAIDLARKTIDPTVVDFRSITYVKILKKSGGHRQELYHFFKQIREAGFIRNDQWLIDETNMAVAMSDFKAALPPIETLHNKRPDDYGILESYLVVLDKCGQQEKIADITANIETLTVDPKYVPNIFNAMLRNGLGQRALDFLYHSIMVSSDSNLRALYFKVSLNPKLGDIICKQSKVVEDGSYVLIDEDGKELYEIVRKGERLEELIGKRPGEQITITIVDKVHVIKVKGIFSKYFKLMREVGEEAHNNRYRQFISFSLDDIEGNDGDILGNLMKITDSLNGGNRVPQDARLKDYHNGKLPLGAFIREYDLVGGMYEKLFGDFNIYIPSSGAFNVILSNGKINLSTYKCVLDLSSLLILCELQHQFNLEFKDKFIVPAGLKQLLEDTIKLEKIGSYTYLSQVVVSKLYIPNPMEGETPLCGKVRYLLKWIEKFCTVEVAERKLDLTRFTWSNRHGYMDVESESVLLSIQQDRMLISDDVGVIGLLIKITRITTVESWLRTCNKNNAKNVTTYLSNLHYIGLQLSYEDVYRMYMSDDRNLQNELKLTIANNQFIWDSCIRASFKIWSEDNDTQKSKELVMMVFREQPPAICMEIIKAFVPMMRNDFFTKILIDAFKQVYPSDFN